MKNSNVLLMGLAVVGLAVGASGSDIPLGGYHNLDDCRVDSFVKTQWGQTTSNGFPDGLRCYNYCITNQAEAVKDYVGCFPVAVAQIMRYWQCVCTNGPVAVDCVVSDGKTVVTNGLTTFGGGYDWGNMPEKTHETAPSTEQCKAIGKLMYDLAVASASTFTPDHTVASPLDVYKCLTERVGGFANAEIAIFNDVNCPYSVDCLKRLVVPNLDAGAPVIFALAFEGAAITHAAVIDGYGYQDGRLMLHANFGAWGNGDGWYCADEGFRVDDRVYPSVSLCLYNLFPKRRGSPVSGRVLDVSRRPVEGAIVRAFSGGTCVAECSTSASGVYAFVLAPGEYVVKAEKEVFSAELPPFRVGATESRQISDAEATAAGNYRSEPEYAPLIGNSFGHDLLLPGLYSDQAKAPTVSPADGAKIFCATQVVLTCATPGAVIRYTLDGSDPTLQSPRYTEPFEVLGERVTVKAIAFARNMNPSEVTTATFTYENAEKLIGDDRHAPMMLFGTNVELTVANYCAYDRADDDPIVNQAIWEFTKHDENQKTESHSAWFRWTAPGTGQVRLVGTMRGPDEWGFDYDDEDDIIEGDFTPYYGIVMAVYAEDDVSSEAVLARTESLLGSDGYGRYVALHADLADLVFNVEQGKTYLIQCECPYHLLDDYLGRVDDTGNWAYFAGPYLYQWQKERLGACYWGPDEYGWYTVPFHSEDAELDLRLTAGGLETAPPPAARMTVPELSDATVRVLADGAEVQLTDHQLQLSPNVNYSITYVAQEGYAFEDGKTVWSAIVRDDTGADFSLAELEGFPRNGPIHVRWNRPTADEGVRAALAASGFGGAVLQKVTTLAAFNAFVGYLSEKVAMTEPLTDGQKTNAYLCCRLGAETIPAEPLEAEDVTIAAAVVQADGSLALELKIKGVEPGETVSREVIEAVVMAEGGDDPANLASANVTLSGEGVADGKIRVNVRPNKMQFGERPAKFFTRLGLVQ